MTTSSKVVEVVEVVEVVINSFPLLDAAQGVHRIGRCVMVHDCGRDRKAFHHPIFSDLMSLKPELCPEPQKETEIPQLTQKACV